MHALFECPEDDNEITRITLKRRFVMDFAYFFVLTKIDFRGYVAFW